MLLINLDRPDMTVFSFWSRHTESIRLLTIAWTFSVTTLAFLFRQYSDSYVFNIANNDSFASEHAPSAIMCVCQRSA
jgi:hypothetical protein